MALRGEPFWAQYTCLDGDNNPRAGDLENHTITFAPDDNESQAINNQGGPGRHEEIDGIPGDYRILITAEEADCLTWAVGGVSSTPGCIIVPRHGSTESVAEAASSDEIVVDQDYLGVDSLTFCTAAGAGIAEAAILAFLTSDWDAGHHSYDYVVAQTETTVGGRWLNPMMLPPGAYTLVYYKTGIYNPVTVNIDVVAED